MQLTKEEKILVLQHRISKLKKEEKFKQSTANVDPMHLCPKCGEDVGFEEDRICNKCGYYETDPQYD
jgi:ribosomal protein L32